MTNVKIIDRTTTALNTLFLTLIALFLMISGVSAQTQQAWENQNFKVKGTWSIEKKQDGNYIILDDAFKTKKAPDLKLFLSKEIANDIKGETATQSATLVAKLSSNKGAQSYKIPVNVNIDDYQSLIIHCEQYSKLWASTSLK
jgi:hypothetical protein